jgi:hypothetical protein
MQPRGEYEYESATCARSPDNQQRNVWLRTDLIKCIRSLDFVRPEGYVLLSRNCGQSLFFPGTLICPYFVNTPVPFGMGNL